MGERRATTQRDTERLYQHLHDLTHSLDKLMTLKEKYRQEISHANQAILKRAHEICHLVRAVEVSLKNELIEYENYYLCELGIQEVTLKDEIEEIKREIQYLEYKSRHDHTEIPPVSWESLHRRSQDLFPPPRPRLSTPCVNTQGLDDMFGRLRFHDDEKVIGPRKLMSSGLLLPAPKPYSTFQIEGGIYTPIIACVGYDTAWVRTGCEMLKLVDREGMAKSSIKLNFDAHAIAVDQYFKCILATDFENKSIKLVSYDGITNVLFTTRWKPSGLCLTRDGGIIVTCPEVGKVIRYNRKGTFAKDLCRSRFDQPRYVVQSRVNDHIYVCEKVTARHATVTGRVLALDVDKNEILHAYDGFPNPTEFTPLALCTERVGHVVVANHTNGNVHILDKSLRFLQILLTRRSGLAWPYAVDVDDDGYIWIDAGKRITIFKYLA